MPDPAVLAPAAGTAVGPLGFGTAPLGNMFVELSDDDAFAVLEEAWAAGIRTFDTAPHYGVGLAERRLGAFLRTKPRDQFVVSTKVGRRLVADPGGAGRLDGEGFVVPATTARVWDFTADGVRRSLDESLERLGLDRVDILYLHDPERSDVGLAAALETGAPALAALRGEGAVGRIGIGSMVNEAVTAAVRTGLLDLAMIANRVTLADHSALAVAVPACRAAGVAVVAAAVFNSGLLARVEPDAAAHFDYQDVPPEVLERVRRIAAVCANHGVDLPTAALHFPLRRGASSVVIGGNAPGQIGENRARFDAPVPSALWFELGVEGLISA
ncbi:MAG: aldo/keto reductase [Microbacteriaceae bacterium]|nr:aldo/keto reductase [Microbacteriaceae bacterium]MCL2793932.1 aldo/keto reductase [Microbacteriaceae bacterium]